MRSVFFDFEYNTSNSKFLNLVCCSMLVVSGDCQRLETYWLYNDDSAKEELARYIKEELAEYTFFAWNAVAEARSVISLGINPRDLKWVDLQLEYKMLINNCHKWAYGKQKIRGKLKYTYPPVQKNYLSEQEALRHSFDKPQSNLSSACYKLLDINIDSEHKEKIRDVIISNVYGRINSKKDEIKKYCESDVIHLPKMWEVIQGFYVDQMGRLRGLEITGEHILLRGRNAVNTAIIESIGYPVVSQWVTNFINNTDDILYEMQCDINSKDLGVTMFRPVKNKKVMSLQVKVIKDFLDSTYDTRDWIKTDKGETSLSLDALQKVKNPRHEYKDDCIEQLIRFLKLKRSLNGFVKPSDSRKETILDFIGNDGRVRCWLNPYGSQTSRFQPKATGFIPLKAAWLRSMIKPKEGRAIISCDYTSEEFLLGALLSGDRKMVEAYASGDVYLYTAKMSGLVPKDGQRKDYETERNIFKTITLGLSYKMSKYGLSKALTESLGRVVGTDEAQDFIDKFFNIYGAYERYSSSLPYTYQTQKYLQLRDGWVMWGDNDNFRSVSNFPVQGSGAAILRKAIDDLLEQGVKVIFPLHDALYVECDIDDIEDTATVLFDTMRDAFSSYFDYSEDSKIIGLDADCWGHNVDKIYTGKNTLANVPCNFYDTYIDKRSAQEYEKFNKFFKASEITRELIIA